MLLKSKEIERRMEKRKEQFILEVNRMKKIAQDNEIIQEEVSQNIESVEEELSQVDVLMKGMKSDILQYRHALDGMTEYGKELDEINRYCTALKRNSKFISRDILISNHTVYLNALRDIFESFDYLTKHPTIYNRLKITESQNRVINEMVKECNSVFSSLLKGERISYIPSQSNEVDVDMKDELLEKYFGITPQNLVLLKDISATLRSCGKYTYMNDCRSYMTMFLKRIFRNMMESLEKKYFNKPRIEILANMYYEMIKYLEIELLLTDELFNNNKDQFTKIIADSLTLFISNMKTAQDSMSELINQDVSTKTDLAQYISELCSTVNSCSLFIDYVGHYEERYQALFQLKADFGPAKEWSERISTLQSHCGQMMKLILEMLSKNTSEMNEQATVNILTTSIISYLMTINKYNRKLNQLALRDFISQYPVITADITNDHYQQYTASVLLALRDCLIRSSQTSDNVYKNHLYLMNNYGTIKEAVSSKSIAVGSFIPTFFNRLFEEEYNAYMSISWGYLLELVKNPITPSYIGKEVRPEDRHFIKDVFFKWNTVYEQLVPAMFYCEVKASMKEMIMEVVHEMVKEYKNMYTHYAHYPFSLHHKSRYLLHSPDEVEIEVQNLFSQ